MLSLGPLLLAFNLLGASAELVVDLGSAETFAILTKTGITTTGVTSVTGDMGTSPIAATAITGFGLILDSTAKFSKSSRVDGEVYAASYASPTPSKMTTAIGDMETAYIDAAGRSGPDFTDLGAGSIEGHTLEPGLYKWGTSVGFTSSLTFTGDAHAVWILQIAADLNLGAGAIVSLSGSAKPENIFWQVAGQTNILADAHVDGIILCATAITFEAGAFLTGRALAQTAVTMIATTINPDAQAAADAKAEADAP